MYTIKHAAEMVGVGEATLRAWERRYGVVAPQRSSGGYRLYSGDDVEVLRHMQALVTAGWSARQAAAAVSGSGAAPATGATTGDGAAVLSTVQRPRPEAPEPRATDAHHDADGDLVEAARHHDAGAAASALDWQFAQGSFEHVVDTWLLPELDRVGKAWADGTVTVAGEHLVAGAVHRRLGAAFDAAGTARTPARPGRSRVLTGLAAGVHHDLGILVFATAARRRGLEVVHLGPDLPADQWAAAVQRHEADAAVVAVPMAGDVEPSREVAARLRRAGVGVVAAGGRHQDELAGSAVALGHRVGPALDRLTALLGTA